MPVETTSLDAATTEYRPESTSRTADIGLLMAWIASLAIHVVLFAVMVAIPWMRERTGRPDAHVVAATAIRDIPKETHFSMTEVPSPFATQRTMTQPQEQIKPQKQNALRELHTVRDSSVEIVGIGTGGGEFSKYGLHVGSGGQGPQFFGLGGEARAARKIVYVVDRSGSMMGVFGDLRKELKRSIDRLRKSQKYHVIFYSTDPPIEAPPGRLVNAIRASKERTFEFIDTTMPEGMTQPIEAMRRAFQLNPDLIYFLSDGDIPEADLLKENLRTWNRKEEVRIFTIAYVSAAGRQLLEEVAREHNGAFRFVSEYDLRD
jgi:hypothetical protein